MKFIKFALAAMLLAVNLLFASPAFADAGKFKKTPEYAEVTQAIADLFDPQKTAGIAPEAIEQQLGNLRLQKYILETSQKRARCQNLTDKTLAIYAKPKKSQTAPTLYPHFSQIVRSLTLKTLQCLGLIEAIGVGETLTECGENLT